MQLYELNFRPVENQDYSCAYVIGVGTIFRNADGTYDVYIRGVARQRNMEPLVAQCMLQHYIELAHSHAIAP